jgi:hypothetical protein
MRDLRRVFSVQREAHWRGALQVAHDGLGDTVHRIACVRHLGSGPGQICRTLHEVRGGTVREMNWDRLFVSTLIGASILSMVVLVLTLLWSR